MNERFFGLSRFGLGVAAAAALAHLCAAWFSLGHYQTDEHDQLLAYAAYVAGWPGVEEPSMFGDRIRSGFMPLLAAAAMRLFMLADSPSPFALTFCLRLASAAISLAAAALFFRAFREEIAGEKARRWTLLALLFLWPLTFYHVRFAAEGWASSFLLLALAAYRMAPHHGRTAFAAAGFFLGLMFLARYQMGLVALSLLCWATLIRRESAGNIAAVACGGAAALLLGFFMDWRMYGAPSFPALEFIRYNFAHLDASARPWHAYLERIATMLPPVSLFAPFLVAAFWWKFPRHVFTWATALFVLAHFVIPNKQTRFLLPMLPFLPFMFALLWEKHAPAASARIRLWISRGLKLSVVANVPFLAFVMLFPAAKEVKFLRDCLLPRTPEFSVVFVPNREAMKELDLHFYAAGRLGFALWPEGPQPGPTLYASRRMRDLPPPGSQPACASLPGWLLFFNVNNWAARASWWHVWRVSLMDSGEDVPKKEEEHPPFAATIALSIP